MSSPRNDKTKEFIAAIRKGDSDAVRNHLHQNPKDASIEFDGETPLHVAARAKHAKLIIPMLVEAGASVNSKDLAGNTPLHIAAINKNHTAINELFKSGADRKIANKNGVTPLERCKQLNQKNGYDQTLALLVEPDINEIPGRVVSDFYRVLSDYRVANEYLQKAETFKGGISYPLNFALSQEELARDERQIHLDDIKRSSGPQELTVIGSVDPRCLGFEDELAGNKYLLEFFQYLPRVLQLYLGGVAWEIKAQVEDQFTIVSQRLYDELSSLPKNAEQSGGKTYRKYESIIADIVALKRKIKDAYLQGINSLDVQSIQDAWQQAKSGHPEFLRYIDELTKLELFEVSSEDIKELKNNYIDVVKATEKLAETEVDAEVYYGRLANLCKSNCEYLVTYGIKEKTALNLVRELRGLDPMLPDPHNIAPEKDETKGKEEANVDKEELDYEEGEHIMMVSEDDDESLDIVPQLTTPSLEEAKRKALNIMFRLQRLPDASEMTKVTDDIASFHRATHEFMNSIPYDEKVSTSLVDNLNDALPPHVSLYSKDVLSKIEKLHDLYQDSGGEATPFKLFFSHLWQAVNTKMIKMSGIEEASSKRQLLLNAPAAWKEIATENTEWDLARKEQSVVSEQSYKIESLSSVCDEYMQHLGRSMYEGIREHNFELCKKMVFRDESDNKLKFKLSELMDIVNLNGGNIKSIRSRDPAFNRAIKKYQAVKEMKATLATDSAPAEKLQAFEEKFRANRQTIEQRRDTGAIKFLKILATIFTFGIAAKVGIWRVKGKEFSDKLDQQLPKPPGNKHN